MIISTTNSIEGSSIIKYHGLVSANIVLGTNIFSDFAASINDFFGGFSETYQNKLQISYNEAISLLSKKALKIGANGIVGLHIDFDEISGKGKSMFMVSVLGTAVQIESNDETKDVKTENNTIDYKALNIAIWKYDILDAIKKGTWPSLKDWDFIQANNIPEIAPILLDRYLGINQENGSYSDRVEILLKQFPSYFSSLSTETAKNLIYNRISESPNKCIKLILDNRLFDAAAIAKLIELDQIDSSIKLLECHKDNYSEDDILLMNNLITKLSLIPDKGRIEDVKGGMLSKAGERYICPNGHKNSKTSEFCTIEGCELNIKGISRSQNHSIERFIIKTRVLSDTFNKNR